MRMRKLFAGLVAAATLFGGLAMGVSSAYADGEESQLEGENNSSQATCTVSDDTKITLTVTDANMLKMSDGTTVRSFKVVKLADYVKDGDKFVGLQTVDDVKETVVSVLKSSSSYANGDPMMWLSGISKDQQASAWRKFADNETIQGLATHEINPQVADNPDGSATAVFDMRGIGAYSSNPSGLYLIVDATSEVQSFPTAEGMKDYGKLKNMLVGTKLVSENNTECSITGSDGTVQSKDTTIVERPDFPFQKVDADGNGVAGAKFVVHVGSRDSQTLVKFTGGTNGVYTVSTADNAKSELISPEASGTNPAGKITLKGLDLETTYYVEEIDAPEPYLDQYRGSFKLTFVGGVWTVTTTDTDNSNLDEHNLVTLPTNSDITKVLNVKTPGELPHTGGAGIAMFSVIGLLLAGAAGVVYAKLRGAKKTLIV